MSEHPITRRKFLTGVAGAGALAAAGELAVTHPWSTPVRSSATDRTATAPMPRSPLDASKGILVLVTLYGGNDGLNTVIPVTDPAYHSARPNLGYTPDQTLALGDGFALNPKLPKLQGLWRSGHLAVVRGVSYPNPSLSHFQSMDIWQTADPNGATNTGWLGRWLDELGHEPLRSITVGPTLPIALRGEREAASVVSSLPIQLPPPGSLHAALAPLVAPSDGDGPLAALIRRSGADLLQVQHDLSAVGAPRSAAAPGVGGAVSDPPATGLGSLSGDLATVAQLISAGVPTRVYEVSVSPFDTHSSEKAAHEALLAELDAGIGSFFDALATSPHRDDVVLVTCSEFGRRVAENASGGTDHGTAAPLFVAGPSVRGGRFYGEQPSLTDLDANGNLKVSTDFRSVYATILDKVLGVDPRSFLGARYPTIGLI